MTIKIAEAFVPGPCCCGQTDCSNLSIYEAGEEDPRVSFSPPETSFICAQLNRFWSDQLPEEFLQRPVHDLVIGLVVAAKVQHLEANDIVAMLARAWLETTVVHSPVHPTAEEDQ